VTLLGELGLPAQALVLAAGLYYGSIGYLKAGLALADRITTVSPTYALEIRTPAFGLCLDGLLRHRAAVPLDGQREATRLIEGVVGLTARRQRPQSHAALAPR